MSAAAPSPARPTGRKGPPPIGSAPPRQTEPDGHGTAAAASRVRPPRSGRRHARRRGGRARPHGDALGRQAAQPHPDRCGRGVRGAPAPGRGRHVRLSRRRGPAALRRPRRLPGAAPRAGPPRAGRRARRRWLRPRVRPRRRLPRHLRPRRHQPGHRHRHRAARLDPHRRDHRQRARRADRQGRLPGDRHHGHHPADDQAQLPGPQRRRPAAHLRRGVPHRAHRPAGPRPHRHHQGRADGRDARAPPRHDRPARLQADLRRAPAPAAPRRRGHRGGAAPADPGRPRHPAQPARSTS